MANKGIRKHQPLRVPSNWNDESRRFVIQLEQILDDIYMRFGRLGLKDLDDELAEDIEYASSITTMTGATASANGKAGLVPAPPAGKNLSILRGDATWQQGLTFAGTISANSDLDTFNTAGMYRCTGNSNAQSLSNCPVSVAFTMVVITGYTTTAGNQFIYPYDDATCYYARRRYSSTWKAWQKYEAFTSPLSIAQGGTGATTVNDAMTAFGLGSIRHLGYLGGSSASTYTKDFTTTGTSNHHACYLIVVHRYNDPGTCNALYLLSYFHNVNTPANNRGSLVPILAAQGGITSFTQTTSTTEGKTTLTLVSSKTYMYARIIQLNSNI